jgi:hypothetical protein
MHVLGIVITVNMHENIPPCMLKRDENVRVRYR